MAHKLKSLESVLDEERRDVLAYLEGPRNSAPTGSVKSEIDFRSPTHPIRSMLEFNLPFSANNESSINLMGTSPASIPSPVPSILIPNHDVSSSNNFGNLLDLNGSIHPRTSYRSMLDVSLTTRSALSSPGNGSSMTSNRPPVRSMLDLSPVSKSPLSPTNSNLKSPLNTPMSSMLHISPPNTSESCTTEMNHEKVIQRSTQVSGESSLNTHTNSYNTQPSSSELLTTKSESECQLSSYVTNETSGSLAPMQSKQTWKGSSVSSITVDTVKGEFFGVKNSGKHGSNHKFGSAQIKSPCNRFSFKGSAGKNSESNKVLLTNGKVIIPKTVCRRLSDVNIRRTSGVPSSWSSGRRRTYSDTTTLPSESGLEKEYITTDGEELSLESSEYSESDKDVSQVRKKTSRFSSELEKKLPFRERDSKQGNIKRRFAALEEDRVQNYPV